MSLKLISASLAFSSFIISCSAVFDANSKSNVALYWGQGGWQQPLSHFCQQSTVDIIPLSFLHVFPEQGNGFPGTNFGNQCSGAVYPGPGNEPWKNQLQSSCPQLMEDIPICQSLYSKKIVLSLGGASRTYQLSGAAEGIAFADFIWGAFGPQTQAWLDQGLPRPFDGPGNQAVEVDGFDFDIEIPSPDSQAGYIAMGLRLRALFETASKQYILTGAPQCIVPDANMGNMIAAVKFDVIMTQFYNTAWCSARSWITANPNFTDGNVEAPSHFGYNDWTRFIVGTASSEAKLYIGVPGRADSDNDNYLNVTEITSLINAYYCDAHFGGIMIWEATSSENNTEGRYHELVKGALTAFDANPPRKCASGTSTTSSSTSTATSLCSSYPTNQTTYGNATYSCSATRTITTSSFKTVTQTTTVSLPVTTSSFTHYTNSTRTSSSTTSSISSSSLPLPPLGGCGARYEVACDPGFCCSQWGFCGKGDGYCGSGCQIGYGICN